MLTARYGLSLYVIQEIFVFIDVIFKSWHMMFGSLANIVKIPNRMSYSSV